MSEEDARMLAAQIIEVGSDAFGGGMIRAAIDMAISAEREACAKICDDHSYLSPCDQCSGSIEPATCADVLSVAIRSRGKP